VPATVSSIRAIPHVSCCSCTCGAQCVRPGETPDTLRQALPGDVGSGSPWACVSPPKGAQRAAPKDRPRRLALGSPIGVLSRPSPQRVTPRLTYGVAPGLKPGRSARQGAVRLGTAKRRPSDSQGAVLGPAPRRATGYLVDGPGVEPGSGRCTLASPAVETNRRPCGARGGIRTRNRSL